MTLPGPARDAWRCYRKLCDRAADRARDVAAALDYARLREPNGASASRHAKARAAYDQAEHEAALAAVAAERLTPNGGDDWALWHRCREAARVATAAPPSAAVEAAADARAAADALESAPRKPWQARAVAKALADARGAAALAASRADWAEPDAEAQPDSRAALIAAAVRALDAAEAALEAARDVVARVRAS